MLPMVPKCLMKGEKVGVCKTTSEECDTPRRQVIYLVPDLNREHRTVRLEAALTLASRQVSCQPWSTNTCTYRRNARLCKDVYPPPYLGTPLTAESTAATGLQG